MNFTSHQRDRALGAIIGTAAGDALGAPFEFKPPVSADTVITMSGGGAFGWAPGEWTDDTSMAVVILQQIAQGRSLAEEATLDEIVVQWQKWSATAPDVGLQTRAVLGSLPQRTASAARAASVKLHERTGRTAGNGSLMRTAPVAIATLDSALETAHNARAISELTHFDPDAGDACVLWCLAIRHAVRTGEIDVRVGLPFLDVAAATKWAGLIDEAEKFEPTHFSNNGWVIHAFQAAWSAIHLTLKVDQGKVRAELMALGLKRAVRAGFDTDTVAAIAGGLLGAGLGASAVPAVWRESLHGWPGLRCSDLGALAQLALNGGKPDSSKWPGVDHLNYDNMFGRFELVRHPHDAGVWLGGVGSLANLPESVTAVVSLCRLGTKDVPERIERRIEVLLIDDPDPVKNLNLEFMFTDTAAAIKQLRDQGHEVFVHCVQSQSRTPSVAITYEVQQLGIDFASAQAAIKSVLPSSLPNSYFAKMLEQINVTKVD